MINLPPHTNKGFFSNRFPCFRARTTAYFCPAAGSAAAGGGESFHSVVRLRMVGSRDALLAAQNRNGRRCGTSTPM